MRDNDRCHCRYSEAVLSTYVIPGLQPGLQISCKRCLSDLLKSISMPPLTRPLPTGAALGRHRNAFLKPVSHAGDESLVRITPPSSRDAAGNPG
jgi:hypothetical protein